ncbi:MAG: EAL and HDOD domain-containing protein [Bacillota bacterium]
MFGYELLYRDNAQSINSILNDDTATSQVLINSFSTIGIENIIQNKKAFINFTKNLLNKEIPIILDSEKIVIEVLENVEVNEKMVEVLKNLRKKGYIVALDDFEYNKSTIPFLKIAHIVKIDFLNTDKGQRKLIECIADKYNVQLLAEKIETRKEFDDAKDIGYSLFQGYFFKKPEILEGNSIPIYPNNYFKVIKELNKDNPDFNKVTNTIKNDMSLSYKLIKVINSAAYGIRSEVKSIKQALVLLGIEELKKWLHLMVIKNIAQDEPKEIMRTSLVRAKTAEKIAGILNEDVNSSELFMVGLFSMLDILMHRSMDVVLEDLPISTNIKSAIKGNNNSIYSDVLDLIVAYEEANWTVVDKYCDKLDIEGNFLINAFLSSIDWGEEVLSF